MDLPFTSPLGSGFGHAKTLIIRGKPHHTRAWFAITFLNGIDLLCSKYDTPSRMAPLQIQARMDENLVVLNTHDGRSWGREDRKPGFAVRHDNINEIRVSSNRNLYDIYFNGVLFASYPHRVDGNSVTHFNFYGDFKVQDVTYV